MLNYYIPKQRDYTLKQNNMLKYRVEEPLPPPLIIGKRQQQANLIYKVMIEELLKEEGITVKKLACDLGLSVSTISRLRNNPHYTPGPNTMIKLINLYCHYKKYAQMD